MLGLAACGGSILQVGEWHTHLPTPPPALTLHGTGMLSPMGNKSKCFFIHSPKFSDDDVSGFWRGIGGMEEATFETVSQQDDGKSLLLEPGELTSWRGAGTPAGETRDSKSWAGVNNHQAASQAHTPASTPQQIYSFFKILV